MEFTITEEAPYPFPKYDRYRTLRLTEARMRGRDVYALQIGCNYAAATILEIDGVLGPKTSRAILTVQDALGQDVDGKAGGLTQRAIALAIAGPRLGDVPFNLVRGQLEHESGYRLGNYSPQRADGSFDAGVAQRNTNYTPPNEGFNPVKSIQALLAHVQKHFDLYVGIEDERRRWGLAAGAWNAPAYANWLAGVNPSAKPSPAALATFETYIESVTAYL